MIEPPVLVGLGHVQLLFMVYVELERVKTVVVQACERGC